MLVLLPLTTLEVGEQGIIAQILGDKQTQDRLTRLGLVVGQHIKVKLKTYDDFLAESCLTIAIGSRVALVPESDAGYVIVEVNRLDRPYWKPEFFRPYWPYIHWGIW